MEMKIFNKQNSEVTDIRSFGGTSDFQVKLRLNSCPDNPMLWKENHYQLNATTGRGDETMHIFIRFLCTCSCDRLSAERKICSNEKKTYQEINTCSTMNTCTECLRNSGCNWCSAPDFTNIDGSPLPRCNNDAFFASDLCPEGGKVDPPRALSMNEDCTNCQHTCSGGICRESKEDILDENLCTSHLSCSDCIHAEGCGWCSLPGDNPNCNRLDNWVSKELAENEGGDTKTFCGGEVLGWRINVSNNGLAKFTTPGFFDPSEFRESFFESRDFAQTENILEVQAKTDVPIKFSVQWNSTLLRTFTKGSIEYDIFFNYTVTGSIKLAITSHKMGRYKSYADLLGLEYEMFCNGQTCDGVTIGTMENLQFDVNIRLLECLGSWNYEFPAYLIVYKGGSDIGVEGEYDKNTAYGILKIVVKVPYCTCNCEKDCMPGYESFHPECRGGALQCGVCGDCPENSFGKFCECSIDGQERPHENISEQIPTITIGQKNNLAGNGVHKSDETFSFSHAIIDRDTPAHHLKCNGTLCKSIAHCKPRKFAIFGDHRLLPGAEITMKFSRCKSRDWYDMEIGSFFGFAVPATNEPSIDFSMEDDYGYFAEELYGWKTWIKSFSNMSRIAEYQHGEWKCDGHDCFERENIRKYQKNRWEWEIDGRLAEKGDLVYAMNTSIINMRVTDSEVIWSWDGFAEGIWVYGRDFNQTSDAMELKHQINIKEKTFYPVIIYAECSQVGDFSTIEIINSKIGHD